MNATQRIDGLVSTLTSYVEAGSLPACYAGVPDYLYDMYPHFSWDAADQAKDMREFTLRKEFPMIDSWFKTRYGFDLRAEIEGAIVECLA